MVFTFHTTLETLWNSNVACLIKTDKFYIKLKEKLLRINSMNLSNRDLNIFLIKINLILYKTFRNKET